MKKTIVITGASRGIGKAIAIELAGKDTNIVINCVNNVDKLNGVKSSAVILLAFNCFCK